MIAAPSDIERIRAVDPRSLEGEHFDSTNERLDSTNERLDSVIEHVNVLTEHVNALTRYTVDGFAGIHDRLDSVIRIVGTHDSELDARVRRIEDHLRLR